MNTASLTLKQLLTAATLAVALVGGLTAPASPAGASASTQLRAGVTKPSSVAACKAKAKTPKQRRKCKKKPTTTTTPPTTPPAGAGSLTGSATLDSAPVRRSSRFVVDAQGRVVQSHGFNIVQKPAPFLPTRIGMDDITFMVENGFNTARIGFIWRAVEPQPGVYDEAYIDRVIALNDLLTSYGIRTLIDFHQDTWNNGGEAGAPDWATIGANVPIAAGPYFQSFYDNAPASDGVGIQTHFVNMWRHVAAKLNNSAGSPNIIGYDPFNEPYPGTEDPTCAVFVRCPSLEAGKLTTFYRAVIAAIRSTGDQHVIWPEGIPTQGTQPTALGDLGDSQIGYNFHQYCLATLLGGVAGLPNTAGTPVAPACNTLTPTQLQAYTNDATARDLPMFLSEFGCSDDSDDTSNYVDIANRLLMSWAVWTYYSQDCRGILTDETQPASTANAKQAKLKALAVPYPQAIAGTPTATDFDRATRTMTLSYSTQAAPGAQLASGALTRIFVPQLHYPTGYVVSVTGATVVSDPTSPFVELLNQPGASAVSVRITPATGSTTRLPTVTPLLTPKAASRLVKTTTRIRLSKLVQGRDERPVKLLFQVTGASASAGSAGRAVVRVDGKKIRAVAAPVTLKSGKQVRGFTMRVPRDLKLGAHRLRVIFKPTDTTAYTPSTSRRVRLVVASALR